MKYFKRIDKDKKTVTVESYSHVANVDGALEITEGEYNAYLATLPPPELSPRLDLVAEVNDLKSRVSALEATYAVVT